jgi:hypothetical protein
MIPWEGTLEGYVKKLIHKDLWKFKSRGYEYEDVTQEAWIVYNNCCKKYIVDMNCSCHKSKFMKFYKSCLHNHFLDMLNFEDIRSRHGKRNETKIDYVEKLQDSTWQDEQLLQINLFLDAPGYIKEVYGILTSKEKMKEYKIPEDKKITNQLLCKKLGFNNSKINLIDILKSYISMGK